MGLLTNTYVSSRFSAACQRECLGYQEWMVRIRQVLVLYTPAFAVRMVYQRDTVRSLRKNGSAILIERACLLLLCAEKRSPRALTLLSHLQAMVGL